MLSFFNDAIAKRWPSVAKALSHSGLDLASLVKMVLPPKVQAQLGKPELKLVPKDEDK